MRPMFRVVSRFSRKSTPYYLFVCATFSLMTDDMKVSLAGWVSRTLKLYLEPPDVTDPQGYVLLSTFVLLLVPVSFLITSWAYRTLYIPAARKLLLMCHINVEVFSEPWNKLTLQSIAVLFSAVTLVICPLVMVGVSIGLGSFAAMLLAAMLLSD